METKVFQLLSGPECEVRRYITEHQPLLFPIGGKTPNMAKNYTKVLKDVIVRIGEDTDITAEKCSELLSHDRIQILIEAGKHTHEYMKAMLSLLNEEQTEEEESKEVEETEDTEEGEEEVKAKDKYLLPLKFEFEFKLDDGTKEKVLFDEVFELTLKPYPFQAECQKYEQVLARKEYDVELPLGKKIRYRLLDGIGESHFNGVKNPTLNTILASYKPRWVEKRMLGTQGKKTEQERAIESVNVDKLETWESGLLKKSIEKHTGNFNQTIRLVHPEDDNLVQMVNVLQIPEFYFPAIEEAV